MVVMKEIVMFGFFDKRTHFKRTLVELYQIKLSLICQIDFEFLVIDTVLCLEMFVINNIRSELYIYNLYAHH